MKTLFSFIVAFLTAGLASAQYCGNSGPTICTPSGTLTTSGFSPNSENLPSFINGASASTVLQFHNYDTILFSGQLLTVQSLKFDSIENLPQGLCWATSQSNNTFANQQDGCIVISGTTCSPPGQYKLRMVATVNIGVDIQTNLDAAGITYFLRVKNSGDIDAVVATSQTVPFMSYGTVADCQVGPPVVNAGSNQTVCNGSNVTLAPSLSGGTAPFTYTWSGTGDALSCNVCKNPSFTITQNSTYSVTVIDANNNSTTGSVSYSIGAGTNNMSVSAVNTDITCLAQQGTSVVTINNGTPPYSITNGMGATYDTAATTVTFAYSQPNDYVVSVTDANGCLTSIVNSIAYTGVVVNYINAVHPDCQYSNAGAVEAVATGGTPPYGYNWSNGITTAAITNQPGNTYYLTVTDATNCHIQTAYNLYPVNGWGPHVSLNGAPDNCNQGIGYINADANWGTPPFTFNWSNGSTSQNLSQLTDGTYQLTVTDALGCSATATSDLQNQCTTILQGTLYTDVDADCTFNTGDSPLNFATVVAYNGSHSYYGITDANGIYNIAVQTAGTYTITPYFGYSSCTAPSACNTGTDTINVVNLGDTIFNNDFGYSNNPSFDLSMHPGWTSANPGFNKKYWVFPFVNGIAPSGPVTITLSYDSNLVYQSSVAPLPVHDPIAHTLTWVLSSVPASSFNAAYRLENTFYVPLSVTVGQPLNTSYSITPIVGDCNPGDNTCTFSEVVTGSHDPNAKEVSPEGAIFEEDSVLTYTIRFQNTGTDSTWFVIIRDTLSDKLDAKTVTNIASSHPYSSFSISGEGILQWKFDPLRLVDSATNEPGSNGFVMFTVKKKPNLPVNTLISNTASVYFDYNEPVVTNTVYDSMAMPNYIFDVKGNDGISVKAMPNPFSQSTNIVISGLNEKYTFELYNITGKLTRKVEVQNGNGFALQRNDLASGVYTYKINSATGKTAFGKLVVQ